VTLEETLGLWTLKERCKCADLLEVSKVYRWWYTTSLRISCLFMWNNATERQNSDEMTLRYPEQGELVADRTIWSSMFDSWYFK